MCLKKQCISEIKNEDIVTVHAKETYQSEGVNNDVAIEEFDIDGSSVNLGDDSVSNVSVKGSKSLSDASQEYLDHNDFETVVTCAKCRLTKWI